MLLITSRDKLISYDFLGNFQKVFDPWPLCKTEVHLKISEHEMLSFSVRKEITKNNNSLAVISLSKVGENEFLQTLKPIYKVESPYCHYLEMLKLRKNRRKDLYIFSRVVTYESLST